MLSTICICIGVWWCLQVGVDKQRLKQENDILRNQVAALQQRLGVGI